MSEQRFESIRQFSSDELCVDAARITTTTSLVRHLGVDGADGWDFIKAFGARCDVDLSTFRASLHFGPEAGGNPFLWFWWTVARLWPRVVLITFADLTESARVGYWQTPAHPA